MEYNLLSYLLGLGTLLLGWILGIIANVINEKLKRKSTKNDIKIGIETELNELQIHLSAVCLLSVCAVGNFNKDFFNWFKQYLIKVLDSAEFIIPQNLKDLLPKISELGDDILFQLITDAFVKNTPEKASTSFTYQNISTPYFDLKISDISLFSTNLQKAMFTLKRDINFLNSDINQVWFYHSKTFDGPTQDNLVILKANLNSLYARISRRSKIMIGRIEETIKDLS